jgi:ABC-type multidrug transport system fused ATPase/permease subunit
MVDSKKSLVAVVSFFLIPPVGIFLIWKYTSYLKVVKVVFSVFTLPMTLLWVIAIVAVPPIGILFVIIVLAIILTSLKKGSVQHINDTLQKANDKLIDKQSQLKEVEVEVNRERERMQKVINHKWESETVTITTQTFMRDGEQDDWEEVDFGEDDDSNR